ncbi:BC_2427 family protein [Viridibacillus sp. NPDC096237]|uniref:BC_2427 family protein n=1 Tax=Viridibacillus sp. NPDC096237 TaxID=3390721 RepID=UPI003D03D62C
MNTPLIIELKRIQSQQQNNYKALIDQKLYRLQNNDSVHTKSLTESVTDIEEQGIKKTRIEDKKECNVIPPSNLENIYSKENIIPFTIFVEIDDFLRLPISGNIIQQSALFLEGDNQTQQSESHSQFIHTELSYPDPMQYRLVRSTINEIISFTSENEMQYAENRIYETIANPIHMHSQKKKGKPECTHNHIEVRVPVVVGEYEIEINMSNQVFFEQEVLGFKEISSNVELRNLKFIPDQSGKSLGNGSCTVSKGKITLEGKILQNFRYSAITNHNENASQQKQKNNRLHQRMALNLTVHLSQIQKIKATLCDE